MSFWSLQFGWWDRPTGSNDIVQQGLEWKITPWGPAGGHPTQLSGTAKAIAATQGPPWELKIPKIAWPALGVSHQDKGGWDWEGETNQRQDHVLIRLSLLQGPIPQASSDKKKIIQHEVFVFKHSLDELKYWYFPDVFSLYFEQWFLFLVDKILVRINMARGRKISSSFTHIPLKSGETHSTLK